MLTRRARPEAVVFFFAPLKDDLQVGKEARFLRRLLYAYLRGKQNARRGAARSGFNVVHTQSRRRET